MKSVDNVIFNDPLFKSLNVPGSASCTPDNLLIVHPKNIYAITPEIRLKVIEMIEKIRIPTISTMEI